MGWEATAIRLKAMAIRLVNIAIRLEASAAIAFRLEATAIMLGGHCYQVEGNGY